jgi:hypothetical protein
MSAESLLIEKIVEANKNNKLAIFIGAGISKSSDTDKIEFPEWSTLIKKLKNLINEKKENDYLKIAQYYYNTVEKEEYYETLKNMFPEPVLPSRVHKCIFDINPHIIITTNWDTILESVNCKYAQFYDVVSNDRELVNSVFQNKIIKMHGDFDHRNIVFKEEDYLNYENNFPLLSNYVKSILSTHTVLFLGYNYNDINLKLIIQWLRNNAEERPEMFLTAFESRSNQINYLRKQKIEVIVLSDIDNNLKGINELLYPYSKMIYTFLDKIFKGYDKIDFDKSDYVVRYIYNKLKPLDSLNGILVDQIRRILTNCDLIFDSDRYAILQFYDHLLTGDYNREIRDIHLKFIKILNYTVNGEKPSPVLINIFSLLVKAGIKGIMLEPDYRISRKKEFIFINDDLMDLNVDILIPDYFDFKYDNYTLDSDEIEILFENAYKLYNLNKFEEAYNLTEKLFNLTFAGNEHVKLFIALYNRNFLLKKLKIDSEFKDKYIGIDEYDMELRYNNLTRQLKMVVNPVFSFLNFSDIYKYLHSSIKDLEKIKKNKRIIEGGGFVYNDDVYKFSGQHVNLLNFVLSNKIMIENYSEFKQINKNYVEIALLRQIQNEKIILIRQEIYSCIKYIENEELTNMLKEYYEEKSSKKGTFGMSEDDKNWLVNVVLVNCANQYTNEKDLFNSPFNAYIENIIFILSITDFSDTLIKNIFSIVNNLMINRSNGIKLFQSLNLFLGLQYRLYKKQIEKNIFIDIIETLIKKILDNKMNLNEAVAISGNYLSNLYGYASTLGLIFEKDNIINNLLEKLSEYDFEFRQNIINNFLLNVYQIANEKTKNIIKDYVLTYKLDDELEEHEKISFKNALVILEIKKFENNQIDEINTYIDSYIRERKFSSILYGLDKQIDYMVEKMNIKELIDVSDKIKNLIKGFERIKNNSIF